MPHPLKEAVDLMAPDVDAIKTSLATVATEAATIDTSLATVATEIATIDASLAEIVENQSGTGAGVAKTAFVARNATAASDTTYREIKAAVASKRHWIHWMMITNITPAETPVINVAEDTGGTPVVKYTFAPGDPAVRTPQLHVFNPPIAISSGMNIGAQATTATGDTHVVIGGFVED